MTIDAGAKIFQAACVWFFIPHPQMYSVSVSYKNCTFVLPE